MNPYKYMKLQITLKLSVAQIPAAIESYTEKIASLEAGKIGNTQSEKDNFDNFIETFKTFKTSLENGDYNPN